ncbi:alpha/beta hydrolase [Spirillospora sp. NPDC048911]|uniref:alpha/beta hydrolase n=1 Tax=Spirillospora sp. NPDC048911 TaxID=3364527 RepID=UPI003724A3B2
MSLDEASAALLATLAELGGKPLHELSPHRAREQAAGLKELYGPGPEMERVEEHITGPGSTPIRLLVPNDQPRGLVVYFHGGGWMTGTIDEFDTLGRQLAERTGCAVALAGYRLAPEHPYPAAVDDAWSALRWLDGNAERLFDVRLPLIVAGDSAGGNLAAVMAHRARRAGTPRIALQILIYPITDCDLETASYADPENEQLLTRKAMAMFWDNYVPDTSMRRAADISPLRAADLTGLPPAVVLTAEHDVLRDEGEAYAERLRAAGIVVTHRRFTGQMHGFFTMVNVLPGSAAGLDHVSAEIDMRLRDLESRP